MFSIKEKPNAWNTTLRLHDHYKQHIIEWINAWTTTWSHADKRLYTKGIHKPSWSPTSSLNRRNQYNSIPLKEG